MQTLAEAAVQGGMYTVPQAAKILGASPAKLRSWIEGYPGSGASPILRRKIEKTKRGTVLGFLDLIESAWVKHFLTLGYSPQTIRKVADRLRQRTDFDHPFASKRRFLADGKSIFEESVEAGEARILDLMNDNFTMGPIVQQSLFDQIFYVKDVAAQFSPVQATPNIILFPKIANGRPVLKDLWIPTETLYAAYVAEGGNAAAVAVDFSVPVDRLEEALNFERILRDQPLH